MKLSLAGHGEIALFAIGLTTPTSFGRLVENRLKSLRRSHGKRGDRTSN
ncbi:MAG: hypothetical protein AB4352_15950 [Hormoscilla sp.]